MPRKTAAPAAPSPVATIRRSTGFILAGIGLLAGIFIGVNLATLGLSGGGGAEPPHDHGTPPQASAPAQNSQIAALEAEVARHPDNAEAWVMIGNFYYDAGQPEKAIPAYEKGLALKPGNPDVLTDLGVMYRAVNQPQKAVEFFDKAAAADPKHEFARFNKGVVLLHDLGRREEALAAWRELLAINPEARAPGGIPVKDLVREEEARK